MFRVSVAVKWTPRYFTDEVGFIFSPLKLSFLFICLNLFLKIIIFVLPPFDHGQKLCDIEKYPKNDNF